MILATARVVLIIIGQIPIIALQTSPAHLTTLRILSQIQVHPLSHLARRLERVRRGQRGQRGRRRARQRVLVALRRQKRTRRNIKLSDTVGIQLGRVDHNAFDRIIQTNFFLFPLNVPPVRVLNNESSLVQLALLIVGESELSEAGLDCVFVIGRRGAGVKVLAKLGRARRRVDVERARASRVIAWAIVDQASSSCMRQACVRARYRVGVR